MNSAIGSQATLANFLAQSLNQDGTLKTVAIDNALHDIADHLDGGGYVRMELAERDKLSFVASGATSLQVQVQGISGVRTFTNETMVFQPSDSITWRYSGQSVYADANFPISVFHGHYYGITPVPQNFIAPDYTNYYVSSVQTPYRQGTLRVYVNGTRLNEGVPVYVPMGAPGTITWYPLFYYEGSATAGIVTGGDFMLSQQIFYSTNIIIDFDIQFA